VAARRVNLRQIFSRSVASR